MNRIPLYFERNGLLYEGYFKPLDTVLPVFRFYLFGRYISTLTLTDGGWQMQGGRMQHLAWFFGDYIIRNR